MVDNLIYQLQGRRTSAFFRRGTSIFLSANLLQTWFQERGRSGLRCDLRQVAVVCLKDPTGGTSSFAHIYFFLTLLANGPKSLFLILSLAMP